MCYGAIVSVGVWIRLFRWCGLARLWEVLCFCCDSLFWGLLACRLDSGFTSLLGLCNGDVWVHDCLGLIVLFVFD